MQLLSSRKDDTLSDSAESVDRGKKKNLFPSTGFWSRNGGMFTLRRSEKDTNSQPSDSRDTKSDCESGDARFMSDYMNSTVSDDEAMKNDGAYGQAMSDFNVSSSNSDTSSSSDLTHMNSLYKKLSTMFDDFKGFMFSNCQLQRSLMYKAPEASEMAVATSSNGVSIAQRLCVTMDNLLRASPTMERFVAFFPSFTMQMPDFNMSRAFVPDNEHFLDCFALFIQDAKPMEESDPDIQEAYATMSEMGDNLTCEIVSKLSNKVISESGPYQCVFEEDIDSGTSNDTFRDLLNNMFVKSGRLRFFQAMKSLGKYKETISRKMSRYRQDVENDLSSTSSSHSSMSQGYQNPGSFFRSRLGMVSGYLGRKSEESIFSTQSEHTAQSNIGSSGSLRSYLSGLRMKRNYEFNENSKLDENAQYRLQEHVMLHTAHWDEFQYDNIEIVIRDDNNSVLKLPYSCAVM
ncbi:hypothetical protein BgAZ_103210 [Babesia gibsoni]|uniref:Uncharacterized protein n=1 Tax=Babesia gibsoni TaxID=33632 RepID=A0AAD8URK1_BABGI|nr:hypothetical protein BgAZ_103210 [Babesia gibsoni]